MARIVITFTDMGRGLDVQCRVEPEEKDTERVQMVAASVGYGLAGHVNQKVIDAIKKKGKSYVN
ncbi:MULTISPECIES: hypothetical protein [Citrobacter]|uniref:hypothetical protein n=1 Tax=Citrobacter TaxID=544 RepID=UPI0016816E9F|nr:MULTISPECIES: hypothetical protein [Citrobacter]ELC5001902.1 hypothetical protein [Salmonella enterica]MCK7561571.1 hypothetical protein [Citrobacter koseri]MDM2952823.1 hypothetical protein [Citrobacter sp. CK203]MDM3031994.1 hypothetical protein [Citrobacter sp. CK186]BCL49837.1 hypothetical protein MPUCK001_36550 [Citrobacter koseri]